MPPVDSGSVPATVTADISAPLPPRMHLPFRASSDGDTRAVFAAFSQESLVTRAFVRGRRLLCPMSPIARHVPLIGRVLDVGCGHGLFAALLASGSSRREITGIDPSAAKIAVAQRSVGRSFDNVRFVRGYAEDFDEGPFDAITMLDVMYLLPDESKRRLIAHCRELLAPDGILLLKTNDTRPAWKYAVVRCEEMLMVKLLGLTLGGQLHFRGAETYQRMLEDAGFDVEMHRLDRGRPVPHRLFICRPTARG